MTRRKRKPNPTPAATRPADAPAQSADDDPWRPWLLGGLCSLFVVRLLFPSESAASHGDGLFVVMLWIALAAFWLAGVIQRRSLRAGFGWTEGAVILLVGFHTIAAVWAAAHASPRPAINMLWEWIALGLSFLLARQLIATRREARAVVAVMVGLAVALAAFGLYQYAYELPKTHAEYIADPDKALRDAGLWFERGSRERELFELRLLENREPIASFALTNSLAGYLAPWLVVTVGIGMGAGLGWKRWRLWLAVAACALPVAACLILTKSRSAYVACAFGLVLAGWLCRRGTTRLDWKLPATIAAVGAILVAAVMVGGGLDAKVLSEASKSLGYRTQYWRSAISMIADHPVAGCGPGNFQNAYTRYMLPEASEEIADPHNFLMEVWATAGTPAVLALVAVLGGFAYALLRSRPETAKEDPNDDRRRPPPQKSPKRQPPGGQPSPTGRPDATAWVLGGAVGGYLLGVWIALVSSAAPGVAPVVTSAAPPAVLPLIFVLPLAIGAVAMLWRWVDSGLMPPLLPAVGLAVLATNLLAAGGIGFPGVAGSFWLLLALGLNEAAPARPRAVSRAAAWSALAVTLSLAACFYASAYGPVFRCQRRLELARRDLPRAVEHLKDAAVADPLASTPTRELATHLLARWLQRPTPKAFADFETSIDTALDLAPNSAATWRLAGDLYRQAASTGRADVAERAAQEAVRKCRKAVDLYPNDALTAASLARALRDAGEEAEFRKVAARALRLDELTPHEDKKLETPVRNELRSGPLRSSSRDPRHGILGPADGN